ncbi:cytochrome c family protein, partial [sediment metagenome]
THIPTTGFCDTCHTNFNTFKPASMNHTGTTNQCSTCHGGGYTGANAQTWNGAAHKGGNPPAQCDVCHHITTAWKPASFAHGASTAGQCLTCHNGTTATGKPSPGHIPTNQVCDVCHRTTAWLPLLTPYGHAGVAAGTCATCHTAPYTNITVKPSGSHIPTSAACDGCHRTTAWLPLKTPYAHTGIAAGTCTTCHTAPYTNITIMPTGKGHIPTTAVTMNWASCDACHKSYSSFSGVRLHATVYTSASQYPGKCPICHELGAGYGLEERIAKEHTSTARKAPNSCDNSGCHTVRGF